MTRGLGYRWLQLGSGSHQYSDILEANLRSSLFDIEMDISTMFRPVAIS